MSRKPTSLGRNVAMLSHASVRPCWKLMASIGSGPPSRERVSLDGGGLPRPSRVEPRSAGSDHGGRRLVFRSSHAEDPRSGRGRPAWYGHARATEGEAWRTGSERVAGR